MKNLKETKNNPNYPEIKIGSQIWMSKNLNVDTFRNGDPIIQAKTFEELKLAARDERAAYCYYGNLKTRGELFGKLYNWHAVNDPRGLAPQGWHIPTVEEWEKLIDFLGGENDASSKLKAKDWWKMDDSANNKSLFNAMPSGYRYDDGDFDYIFYKAKFWTPELTVRSNGASAYTFLLESDNFEKAVKKDSAGRNFFMSVRCIKD